MKEVPASITAIIKGKIFREAQIFNEKSLIKIRPVVEEFDWMILHTNQSIVELSGFSDEPKAVPYKLIDPGNQIINIPSVVQNQKLSYLFQNTGL
jgi:hypothetical protein